MSPELPPAPGLFASKRLRAAAMRVLPALALGGLLVLFALPSPRNRIQMPLPPLKAEDGRAWSFHLPKDKTFLSLWQRAIYKVPPGDQFNSYATLFEDGRALPLSRHADVRDLGEGRYAHLGFNLLFSTTRNDDPRSNGRIYEIELQARPRPQVYLATLICLLGFIGLARPSLVLRMQALPATEWRELKTEWRELKTAWARNSGRPFPARLWRAFLRPETADEPGFPAEGVLRPYFWTRTAPCLAGVMLLALLASYFSAYEGYDWFDAIAYQAHGRSLAEHGTPLPAPHNYSLFLEYAQDGRDPSQVSWDKCPSVGFQLFIGYLGKWRGDYSQANGILVSAFFSVLFSAVLFTFAFAVTRGRFLSFALVAACLANPIVMNVAGRPLTDMSQCFFLLAALWPMARGKGLLSGFIFGLGYLFREVGLTYLPLLALASPKSVTWRGFARSLSAAVCGYAFWLAVNHGLFAMFRGDGASISSGRSWYLDWLIGQLKGFDIQLLPFLGSNMETLARHANPLGILSPLAFALIMTLVFLATSGLGRRLVLIGLWGLFVSAAFMIFNRGIDTRYAAPAICLFWLALALAVNRFRFRSLWFAVLLAWAVFSFLPRHVDEQPLRALSRPWEAWAHITAPYRAKMRFGRLLKSGSVILSPHTYLEEVIYNHPVRISQPDYETWRTSKGNEMIDGITFFFHGKRPDSWPWPVAGDILEDAHGVRFVKFKGFGDDLDELKPPEYLLFLRER